MPYKSTTVNVSGINDPLQLKHKFQTSKLSWEFNSSILQYQEQKYLTAHETHNDTVVRYTSEGFESILIANRGPQIQNLCNVEVILCELVEKE